MIAAYRGVSFVSKLIRWFNRSAYSHVSWIVVSDDGRLQHEYEAWGSKGVVRNERWGQNHTVGTRVDLFDFVEPLPSGQLATLVAFLEYEVGCKYDWRGVVAFVAHWLGESRERWFCSELISAACEAARVRLQNASPYLISPNDVVKSTLLHPFGTLYVGDARWYSAEGRKDRIDPHEMGSVIRPI